MSAQEKTRLMNAGPKTHEMISDLIKKSEETLLNSWIKEQLTATSQVGKIKDSEVRRQCEEFLKLFLTALNSGILNVSQPAWEPMRELLGNVSRSRSTQGFSPSETAMFIFSLKSPLFSELKKKLAKDPDAITEALWLLTEVLDKLGLYTMEIYQKSREEVILRQQQDMLELSTPVVSLADGILALPLIGTLDSARTQVVMESLLQSIVSSGSTVAIIDITGVPTVDTLVAQHLIKTVTAARLMGADCIISGIRPQIAQTIVHLGVDLGNVTTKATLAAAFRNALDRRGLAITKVTLAGAKALEKN